MTPFHELLLYRSYRTLTGDVAPIDVYRHNGKLAIRFAEPQGTSARRVSPHLWAMLCQNLTSLERSTWRRLLAGRSIAAIASEDGVKRAAIYARIRGRNGTGGMVRKNRWVAAWWARRQHTPL